MEQFYFIAVLENPNVTDFNFKASYSLTKLTLAVQRGSGEIAIRDINGSREITEVSEGVNVSF